MVISIITLSWAGDERSREECLVSREKLATVTCALTEGHAVPRTMTQ